MATQSPETEVTPADEQPPVKRSERVKSARVPVMQVLRELNWLLLLLVGIAGGVTWVLLLTQNSRLQFFAGLLPVAGGILVGRQTKRHINWHAGMLSLITTVAAVATAAIVVTTSTALTDVQKTGLSTGFLLLIPFPAFGVITSARSELKARETREAQERRGGKLDRPGRVKSLDDLRALSLNQLGGYVADLFRRHEFLVDDYRFDNRENLIEFNLRKDDQPWIVRVTVDDKVKQSSALQLHQYIRSQGITKAVLITSMEFQDQATRWAKDKAVALIDGPTLMSMND